MSRGKKALIISSVTRNSVAERKGIQRGDAVVAVNGMQVNSLGDLNRAMERGLSRSNVALVVVRGGYPYTLSFALD